MTRKQTRHYAPSFGSISHGTMLASDLLPALAGELALCAGRRRSEQDKASRKLVREAFEMIEASDDLDSDDDAQELLNELFDCLNAYAPSYGYFGAHEGDGADYGFWLSSDWQQDFREGDGVEVSDLSEVSRHYAGEVLVISDHGNATLYTAARHARFKQRGTSARTRFREVWSVV